MFISETDFFFIPDTGNKKALDPGSGSATTLWDTVGTLDIVYRNNVLEETVDRCISICVYFSDSISATRFLIKFKILGKSRKNSIVMLLLLKYRTI